MHILNGGDKTLNKTRGLNTLSLCAHVCSGTNLFTAAEIPAAPAKSSILGQKCSTFPQQEFQQGGESLHMSYTSVKSCTVGLCCAELWLQALHLSPACSGVCLCVTGLRVNNISI